MIYHAGIAFPGKVSERVFVRAAPRRSEKGVHPPSRADSRIPAKTNSKRPGAAIAQEEGTPRPSATLQTALREFTRESKGRSWWAFLSTLALLMVAVGGTLALDTLWVRLGLSVLSGLLIVRLFVIYHDHQHRALLDSSKLAQALMFWIGLYSLAPKSIWRSSHNHHHQHNSRLRSAHIGSFPIMTRDRYLKATRWERFQYLFVRHPLTILFGYFFVFLIGMCCVPFFRHPKRHWDSLLALGVHVALAAGLLVYFDVQTMLLALVMPQFLASALGTYLFYAQHNFPGVHHHTDDGWTYEGAALESSSYMKMNPVMAWFTGNIGYHHIHHLDPRIPFYRLPEAMRKLPELQNPKTTSLAPAEIFRCLRLKVWDPEAGRMIGLKQVHATAGAA